MEFAVRVDTNQEIAQRVWKILQQRAYQNQKRYFNLTAIHPRCTRITNLQIYFFLQVVVFGATAPSGPGSSQSRDF